MTNNPVLLLGNIDLLFNWTMKILHLCFDGNFIENSMGVFDHFYPNSNIWMITEVKGKSQRIVKRDGSNIIWIAAWKNSNYHEIAGELSLNEEINFIVCHGISNYNFYIDIIRLFQSVKHVKVYWIFWGYELYMPLGYSGKMQLVDNNHFWNRLVYFQPTKYAKILWSDILRKGNSEKRLTEMLNYVDYFCFWLYEDYQLLKKFYPCHAEFKHFQYSAKWKDEEESNTISELYFKKKHNTIIVNHQASLTGNHITIFRKLKSFKGIENYDIYAPLSYGSKLIEGHVCREGKKCFDSRFHPIREFLPKDEYFRLIGNVEVALFGNLRQEAAGNIIFLLTNGTKVFMRESNTLFHYYRKLGYIIFSFEHDLNSIDDLKGLTLEEKRHNAQVRMANRKSYEDFMPYLFE